MRDALGRDLRDVCRRSCADELRLLNPLPVMATVAIGVLLLASSHAGAAIGIVNATYGRDNLGIYGQRTELGMFGNETTWGLVQANVHATRAGGADLAAIPSGDRWTSGGGALGWVASVGPLESRALAGFDVLDRSGSWRLQLEERFAIRAVPGLGLKAGLVSGWLDGWLTFSVRSTAATGAVGYSTDATWSEAGVVWDARSGGVQPGTELTVSLADNRLMTAYGWGLHAWLSWLMLGMAVAWNDADVDFHQPVRLVGGVATYLDYPYPTPHKELALGALLQLRVGRFAVKTNWPFFSTGRYRYDDPDPMGAPGFYSAHGMAIADVRGGVEVPLGGWTMSIDLQALSRPYRAYAWFTADAWNQVGLSLTVRYATASPRSVE